MTRLWLVIAAMALLPGCDQRQSPRGVDEPTYRILANPNVPIVSVIEDNGEVIILVDQEPVFHRKNASDKSIMWTLDVASKHDWKLANVEVAPDPQGNAVIKDCAQVGSADHRFWCKTNLGTPGMYKYKVTVERRVGGQKYTSPDPFVRNG